MVLFHRPGRVDRAIDFQIEGEESETIANVWEPIEPLCKYLIILSVRSTQAIRSRGDGYRLLYDHDISRGDFNGFQRLTGNPSLSPSVQLSAASKKMIPLVTRS